MARRATSSTAGSPSTEAPARLRFRSDRDPLPAAAPTWRPPSSSSTRAADLTEEVFGPVLHVVRWRADELDALFDDIARNRTASRSASIRASTGPSSRIAARLRNGNVYVNRNMIGAVVGTQPFGGSGLSGTGPKAGGPNYLRRFATEQVITSTRRPPAAMPACWRRTSEARTDPGASPLTQSRQDRAILLVHD